MHLVKDRTVRYAVKAVDHDASAYQLARAMIGDTDREHLLAIFLNSQNAPIGTTIVAIGGIAGLQTTSREVFRAAIVAGAAAVVLAHNHPSGNATPSREDVAFTRTIVATGKLLGVPCVDHLVIGDGTYTSMAKEGLL